MGLCLYILLSNLKKITIPDCKGKTFPSCFLWKCLHVFPLPCSCGWLWRRRRDSSPLPSTLGSHSSRIWTTCLEGTAQSEEQATLNMKKKLKILKFNKSIKGCPLNVSLPSPMCSLKNLCNVPCKYFHWCGHKTVEQSYTLCGAIPLVSCRLSQLTCCPVW